MKVLRANYIDLKGLFKMEIISNNVNELFSDALWRFKTSAIENTSRNGDVFMINEPVLTKIKYPLERVLFYPRRNANPIFHLMESIWILAGHSDVNFVQQFNSRIGQFSDNGRNFNAAYGYRMRHQFITDQLIAIVQILNKDPQSRQAVIQLWDSDDLMKNTKDKACNTQMMFSIRNGCLDLMVTNRSNDFWWGYAGANIVHFTMIQEFVAIALDVPVGSYFTVSNNLHLYKDLYDATPDMVSPPNAEEYDYYSQGIVRPYPLYEGSFERFLEECSRFCNDSFADYAYTHKFFIEVARPLAMISYLRRQKLGNGLEHVDKIMATDWKLAVKQWILRKENKDVSK
jgi:thymidylate synthase